MRAGRRREGGRSRPAVLLWRAPVAVFLYRARPPPCRGRSRSGLSAAAAMAITREGGGRRAAEGRGKALARGPARGGELELWRPRGLLLRHYGGRRHIHRGPAAARGGRPRGGAARGWLAAEGGGGPGARPAPVEKGAAVRALARPRSRAAPPPSPNAFEERGDIFLHPLSLLCVKCIARCLFCWRRHRACTVPSARQKKIVLPRAVGVSLRQLIASLVGIS